MNRHLLLSVVGFFLVHGAAHAGLVKVASNASNGTDLYVDSGFQHVNNEHHLVRVTTLARYNKDRDQDRTKGSSQGMTFVLNCKDKTIAVEKMMRFSATGATVSSLVYPADRITTDKLSEGTLMWTMQDIVCDSATHDASTR